MSDQSDTVVEPLREYEIRLSDVVNVLWRGKIVLILFTTISALLAVGYSLILPDIYISSALLAPKQNEDTGTLGRLASQYGGIASIAGISVAGIGGGKEVAIAIATLRSRRFFEEYLYDDVLTELMAVKDWNSQTGKLTYDSEIYDSKTDTWVREINGFRESKPTVQEGFEVFSKCLTIVEEDLSGFVTVSIEHASPKVAKRWVDMMIVGINEAIRNIALLEAQRSIDYLTEQLDKTPLVNIGQVFAQLIEEQTKTIMLANASDDYVFRIIEPPVESEKKARPARALISMSGTLLGAALAAIGLLIYQFTSIGGNPRVRNTIR